MWFVFALLSSIFAALTAILAKLGLQGVNATLATAIRTVVILGLSWALVFFSGAQQGVAQLERRSWLFLVLSGFSTGLSWLCYFRALQLGDASRVAPVDKFSLVLTILLAVIFLHEKIQPKTLLGCILIAAGSFLML